MNLTLSYPVFPLGYAETMYIHIALSIRILIESEKKLNS